MENEIPSVYSLELYASKVKEPPTFFSSQIYSNCYLWYSNHYTIEEKEKNQLINTKINYKSHKFENSGSARVLFIYKKLFF